MGSQKLRWAFAVAFLTLLWLPFGLASLAGGRISYAERRFLANVSMPTSLDELLYRFPSDYDRYFRDNFGFRDILLGIHYKIISGPLFARIRHDALVGKGDWLYWGNEESMVDIRGNSPAPTEERLRHWLADFDQKRTIATQGKTKLLLVIAPDKASIYPEFLPDGVRAEHPATALDHLTNFLKQEGNMDVDWILDLKPGLLEKKKTSRRELYYRGDSHWNALGALYAHRLIVDKLKKMGVKVTPSPVQESDIVSSPENIGMEFVRFPDDSVSQYGLAARHPSLACIQKKFVDIPQKPGEPLQRVQVNTNTCHNGQGTLVIIGDSFTEALHPYLSTVFRRVVILSIGDAQRAGLDLIKAEKPDAVMFEIVQRRLNLQGKIWH